jgi:hypothetical protein
MPFHGSATADAELHNPRGVDAVPLDLTDNSATAYRVRRDDGSTYPNILSVDTTTSAVAIALGNSTDNPAITATTKALTIDVPQSTSSAVLVRRGSGDPILSIDTAATSSPHNIRVREGYVTWDEIPSEPAAVADKVHVYAFDNAGTVELRARTNAGIVNLLDVGSALTGTTNLSWTVDEDATAAADTDPFLRLLGGDGVAAPNNDLVRTTITQDSSAETVSLVMQRSRNGGAYTARPSVLSLSVGSGTSEFPAILFPSSVIISSAARAGDSASSVLIGPSPTIPAGGASNYVAIGQAPEIYSYSVAIGSNAASKDEYQVIIGYQASAAYSVSEASIAIGYSASGDAASAIAIGRSSIAQGTEAVAIGRSASAGHANSVAVGRAATTTAANQLVLGSASYATTALFLGRGVTSATSGTTTINATGGSGTNIAGHALVLAAGRSTGDAVPAELRMQVAQVTTSGTTAQTLFNAASITGDKSASNTQTNTALSHHMRRSQDLSSAANYSWHIRATTANATAAHLWTLDLSTFLSGAHYVAGGGMIWCRVFAVGLYSGTRYSALYGRRARFETTGAATSLIDTGNTQHEGTDLEDDNGWDCEITLATDTLRVTCTGDADHAVGWHIDVWVSFSPDA